MSEPLVYNFGAIEGGASEIHGYVATTQGLLDEGKASLTTLQSVWGGSGSSAYQAVQTRWDNTAHELNLALQNLAQTISEAGQSMLGTDHHVTGMFSG